MLVGSQPETAVLPSQVATHVNPSARRVLVSLNPRAGSRARHDLVRAIEDTLVDARYRVTVSTSLGELSDLAHEGLQTGELRAVIAVGGDGTASVVRNHVPLAIPLLPLPMGTENLLGRVVDQAVEPAAVRRTLDEGVVIGLDLGRAGDKYFLLMVSAGFDAEVIRALHESRRGNIHRTAYVLPTLQAIRGYTYPQIQVFLGDAPAVERPQHCRWLFAFNLPLYALGLQIAPDAIATDGLLDLCMFQGGRIWSPLRYLWHVKLGGHLALDDAALIRSQRFRIEGPSSPSVAYQIDGDYGGTLPVDVEIRPGELRLLVSQSTARRLGFSVA
jgi:diacylglycerol kinase family enzyme